MPILSFLRVVDDVLQCVRYIYIRRYIRVCLYVYVTYGYRRIDRRTWAFCLLPIDVNVRALVGACFVANGRF